MVWSMTPLVPLFSCAVCSARRSGCAVRAGAAHRCRRGGGVDADAVLGVFHGQGRGQGIHAALGRRVGHAVHTAGGDDETF